MNYNLLAENAIAQIPKILTLMDRNVHSPNYGCFDRNFWQYKIIDFPSGMSQEFVLPLALAFHTNIPENPFYQKKIIKEWVEAGITFAMKSSHKDGSCDDYFPFEKAGGAAAFSLLAFIESYKLMELDNSYLIQFMEQRANWLAHHQESGRLTNHQALIVLCLELLSDLLKTDKWNQNKKERLEQVLSWQNHEGWFQEYEGCDPGYHSLTITCLAWIYELNPDPAIKNALIKAVNLALNFIHPDGSYGGEYTSRNTYNFFPYGFELVGKWMPEALNINDIFLKGLESGHNSCYADDHIIGHHTWNYLLAWRDFIRERPPLKPRPQGRFYLKEGGILIDRRENYEIYIGLNKGGVFKLFKDNKLLVSDTQFSFLVKDKDKTKNAVAHLISENYKLSVNDNEIIIQGIFGWAKQKQMTSLNLIILRIVMVTLGRFFPNLIRKILQKVLITGKKNAPFGFYRSFQWNKGHWVVYDQITAKSWDDVMAAGIGGDQTSIYVVMSRTFQVGQLQSWIDVTKDIKSLQHDQKFVLERKF